MLKTVIYCIFVLTFSAALVSTQFARANFSDNQWTYRFQSKSYTFARVGEKTGSPMVSVQKLAETFSLKFIESQTKTDFVLLNKKTNQRALFSLRHKHVRVLNSEIDLSEKPRRFKSVLAVPLDFGDRVLTPLLSDNPPFALQKIDELWNQADLVIDPGHGGNDWGTSHQKTLEKTLALTLSKELREAFVAKGVKTFLTRQEDQFVSLKERANLLNKLKPKLFLSVHFNFSFNESLKGYEIYLLSFKTKDRELRKKLLFENQGLGVTNKNDSMLALFTHRTDDLVKRSMQWAKLAQKPMNMYLEPRGQGVFTAPFYILMESKYPALLLEFAYLNHKKEREFFLNSVKRRAFVKSFVDALAPSLLEKANESN